MTFRTIPLVEPWVPASCAEAVKAQVQSGFLGPGPTTRQFSEELASYLNTEGVLLTTSGTIALSVAAHALGLKPGDEILLPAYGVISTINAYASIGLRPRLVDVDISTCCISPETLAAALTPQAKAVSFVNFSGHTGRTVKNVQLFCAERDIPLIEDAACALGHQSEGQKAGTFGDVGAISFSVPKVITTGQGGALVARSPQVLERAQAYIDHGDIEWRRTGINRNIGTNLRFNDVLASLGLAQLRDLDARLARRREYYEELRRGLGSKLYSVPGNEAPLHSIVFTPQPERLVQDLNERGVMAITSPYRTLNQHPAYKHLRNATFPNADFWTSQTVYLPFGMSLTKADAAVVLQTLEECDSELLDAP